MRAGRPMDGDSQKGGALVWFRTAQDTGGEYSLAMGWGNQSTLFFRTITPATQRRCRFWKESPTELLVELRPASASFEKWIVMLQNMHADGLTTPDQRPKSIVHAALFLTE